MSASFPPLQRPSVFIAAPGDLEYLRDAAILEFEALRRQAADDHGLQVYDWVFDKAEDGFKDWIPAQAQIPLPSDEKCRAVICMLGERLGTPLTPDFDTRALGPLEDIRSDTARLVHPWIDGAEEAGGFALTGTVFEYLAALRASAPDGRPPTMLLLVGDDTIRDMPDPLDALWGGGRLRRDAEAAFKLLHPKGNRARNEFRDWEDRFYRPQLLQLGNFVRFLNSRRNVFPRIVEDEEQARRHIRDFLRRELDLRVGVSARDPFKGLEAYAEDDSEVFFGRKDDQRKAVDELTRLWDDASLPTFYGVTGGSGVGKSSMARAALVGHLCHHTSDGRYVGCVVRPIDLLALPGPDAAPQPLLTLLRQALAQAMPGTRSDEAGEEFLAVRHDVRPAFVVKQLARALQARGDGWRLLLAFDQFEELLDQWLQPEGGPMWAPVIELILLAARHPAIGVIYTLQTNRVDLISQDPRLGPLWANGGNLRLAFPMSSLDDIIRMPFKARDLDLEPKLVRELSRRIGDFALQAHDGESQGSLLPLVSLTLRRIFMARADQAIERHLEERKRAVADAVGDGVAAPVEAAPGVPVLRLADCEGLLDVSGAIAQLADEAVAEARVSAGASWSDDTTIGNLLRRLVRLGDAGSQRLTLPSAALSGQGAVGRLADALSKRRLLLPEPGGRFKLVHEAVLVHWPAARKWLDGERRLLRLVGIVGYKAEDWVAAAEQAEESLVTSSDRDLDEAAELLVQWGDIFLDDVVRPADARLRDYALALLKARPMPLRVVEAASGKPCHVHVAAAYGALDLLKGYIAQTPACVHAARKDKRTPLFNVCFSQRPDILEALIEAGAKVDVSDEDQWLPVHAAGTSGHVAVMERLVRAGASAVAPGGAWQLTPLHLAAGNDHAELATWLLARAAADPGVAAKNGTTPLHRAAEEGHVAMIQLLAAGRPELLQARLVNDATPLHLAAYHGRAPAVRALIALQAPLDARAKHDWADDEERAKRPADKPWNQLDWTPLHMAVRAGHEAAARELLVGKVDADACTDERESALMMAVAAGNEALVRLLLEFKPSLELRDDKERTALHIALSQEQYAVAELLVAAGADVDAPAAKQTVTPLHVAVREGNEACVQFLLSHGASTAARGPGGRTPLHVVTVLGNLQRLQLLVERGAEPALFDAAGQTALHLAAAAGHHELLAWLLQRPDVDAAAVDHDGMSALHLAAQADRSECVAMLLLGRPPVDPRDADGWTPLMLAAQCGHAGIVSLLLHAEADAGAVAERPAISALQAAAEGGHAEVIALLRQAGASLETASPDKPPALVLAIRNAQFETAHSLLDQDAALQGPGHDPALLIAAIKAHQGERRAQGLPISPACASLLARLRTVSGVADDAPQVRRPRLSTAFAPFMRLPSAEELGWSRRAPPDAPAADMTGGLMHYPWRAVPPSTRELLCEQVGPIDGKWRVTDETRVEAVSLPWYEGMVLFRLTDPAWLPKLAIYYLGDSIAVSGSLYRLNGTSPPIHEVNATAPLVLNEQNVLGYMKFFCFFVRGQEGPFYILESADDPVIPPDAPESALAAMRNTVRAATLEGRDEHGNYLCSAVVWYSNAVFWSDFRVQQGGMVEMVDDEPIAADLPMVVDLPVA